MQSEESADRTYHLHNDNGVSVRHIVTELEAICHPASGLPIPSPSPSSSPSPCPHAPPQLIQPEHQEEKESSEHPHGSLTPPAQTQAPSALPCDWPPGSVRRATEQLEQKLRQETETATSQRSPVQSPSTEHSPVRLPLSSAGTEQPPLCSPLHSTEQRLTQGDNAAFSAKSKDEDKHTGSQRELQRLDFSGTDKLPDPPCSSNSNISQVSGAIPIITHPPTGSHMPISSLTSTSQLLESSLDTSTPSRRNQLHSQQCWTLPQASSNLIRVDGVTVQESGTDESSGCGPDCDAQIRLARGSQDLERIQQTLRELQAFLHESVSLEVAEGETQELGQPRGPRDSMDTEPGPSEVVSSEQTSQRLEVGQRFRDRQDGKSFLEPTGWHRAMELEARIRQAGLTPPSLMKRSASLAKLDCLELSANDLSDLDLRPHTRTTSSHLQDSFSPSPTHPDDTWKKQKVLVRNTCIERTGLSLSDSLSPPSLCLSSSSSPRHLPLEDKGEREEPDGSGSSRATSLRQQGRGHSSRRPRKSPAEKKQRGLTVLYNTM